jgi:hypothetical protein
MFTIFNLIREKMKRYQKVMLALMLLLITSYAAVQVYFSFFLEEQLRERLVEEVNSKTDDRYHFDVADLSLSLTGKSVQLDGVTLNTSDESETAFELTIGAIAFNGLDMNNLTENREFIVNEIIISDPSLSISLPDKVQGDSATDMDTDQITRLLTTEILTYANHVSINEITIESARAGLISGEDDEPVFSFSDTDLKFYNTVFDSSSQNTDRIFPFDDTDGTIRNANYRTSNGIYEMRVDQFEFSTTTSLARMNNFVLDPIPDENEFFEITGHRTDRIEASVSSAELRDINMENLMDLSSFELVKADVTDWDVKVFRNKQYPREENPGEKPLPQQLLDGLDFSVGLDSVILHNGTIRYTELEEHSDERGIVEFAELNATVTNITNIGENIRENGNMVLDAETSIMGESKLNAHFILPYGELSQTISGNVEALDPTILNAVLEPLALIRIEDGEVHSLQFDMELGENSATGEVTIIYDGLNISLLDDDGLDKNLRTRIGSFIANTFAVKSDNSADDPRIGEVSFERDREKSVFNYWWKSLQSGLESSIGL